MKNRTAARLETGVVTFDDGRSWPGYFLRGKHALDLAHVLERSTGETAYEQSKLDYWRDQLRMVKGQTER